MALRTETPTTSALDISRPAPPGPSLGTHFPRRTSATWGAERCHATGPGLAFCKLAIETHGGTMSADSNVSAGSTVWFELPV